MYLPSFLVALYLFCLLLCDSVVTSSYVCKFGYYGCSDIEYLGYLFALVYVSISFS